MHLFVYLRDECVFLQAAFLSEEKSNKSNLGALSREALETWTAVFHNRENEIAIDRNGDIRSLFPWTACERLLQFRACA